MRQSPEFGCHVSNVVSCLERSRACEGDMMLPSNIPVTPTRNNTASIIAEYKTSVQSSYENVKEYNSRPGENVLLSERYTDLLMVECHRKPEEREEEIRSRGQSLQDILRSRSSEAYSPITVEQLFRPDDRGCIPKAVILQGHPGYGKSFTSQKIVLDWASGTLFKELFHLVLHLECKEINGISGECSLVDLLNYSTEDVLRDQKIKVLFLVDGFDELKVSLVDAGSALPKDPFTKAPVQATLKALLKGHILPQCKLLLTTRSTATMTLSSLVTDSQRFVDILGFTEDGVKDYFHSFFQDEHKADALFEYVRTNETLYTSCFIPVICWVTCTVFRAQERKGAQLTKELTNTSIYANFVSILPEHHSPSLSVSVPVLLSSLGRLAEKGMKEKCVLFTKKDVLSTVSDPECTVSHLTTGPFLCELSCKRVFRTEEMFSFMHLSFQEFFVALHYNLDQEGEKRLLCLLNSQQHWESQRQPVIQFLFGLVNKEMQNLEFLQSTLFSSYIRRHLEKWVLEKIADHKLVQSRLMFILYCLHELHEDEFVRTVMDNVGPLCFLYTPLTKVDCWVLRYCLLCCTTIKKLKLSECEMTAEMLRMLQPALSKCQVLSLDLEAVDDDDIWTFLSTLMKGHKLKKLSLDVVKGSLEDVGMFISSLADKHILTGQSNLYPRAPGHVNLALVIGVQNQRKCREMKALLVDGTLW
ncbi:NACHT, LRR and PYD domains-containing protein 1 homolog [Engraulis encrasicolus]|uniref:NACHT, LRR and PYD domains-containing protein 1 homolog n=1 Tax=Engraulis encrasicolus TaxID=184585 RepID=UPI002FD5418E